MGNAYHNRRPLWETAFDLERDADLLRRRAYGVIEVVGGRLARIVLRPWPKLVSLPEVWWLGGNHHARAAGDRCRLYYNQPRGCPNFLALKYVVSSHFATFASLRRALRTLDEIARIKQIDAIVCEASNLRISERSLARYGWERHCLDSARRHYIKRFYGEYAAAATPALSCDPLTPTP
jgi:hypothetical protein